MIQFDRSIHALPKHSIYNPSAQSSTTLERSIDRSLGRLGTAVTCLRLASQPKHPVSDARHTPRARSDPQGWGNPSFSFSTRLLCSSNRRRLSCPSPGPKGPRLIDPTGWAANRSRGAVDLRPLRLIGYPPSAPAHGAAAKFGASGPRRGVQVLLPCMRNRCFDHRATRRRRSTIRCWDPVLFLRDPQSQQVEPRCPSPLFNTTPGGACALVVRYARGQSSQTQQHKWHVSKPVPVHPRSLPDLNLNTPAPAFPTDPTDFDQTHTAPAASPPCPPPP